VNGVMQISTVKGLRSLLEAAPDLPHRGSRGGQLLAGDTGG
jgi:hypothetical protein